MFPLIIQMTSYLMMLALRTYLYPANSFFAFTLRAESICIGLMFIATGIAHFTSTQSMVEMFPGFVPFKKEAVLLSGVFELALGVLLIFAVGPQRMIAFLLILFLIASLPLNVYSAVANTGLGAKGLGYLWFRVPLQIFWMAWISYFTLMKK